MLPMAVALGVARQPRTRASAADRGAQHGRAPAAGRGRDRDEGRAQARVGRRTRSLEDLESTGLDSLRTVLTRRGDSG